MKKFEFRLAAALKLRENQLKAERTQLQQLFAEEQGLKDAIEKLAADRREAADFIQSSASVTATDLRAFSTFSLGADAHGGLLRDHLARQAKKNS